ncbi:MAG: hypothetical protein KC415_22645, partial [Anaerolineales bacterium]|nr:hypothetical protein [Anaerolineales bacterium]
MLNTKRWRILSLLLVFALILAACGGNDATPAAEEPTTEETTTEETATEETATEETGTEMTEETMVEAPFAVMPGGFMERALAGEFA